MNITEALPALNLQSMGNESKQNRQNNSVDALLFSLVLNSYLQDWHGAGQVTGEFGDKISIIPYPASSEDIPDTGSLADISGQDFYLQILQNILPAGKEANSGLGVEQSPIDFSHSLPGYSGEQKDLISADTVNRFGLGKPQAEQQQIIERFTPNTRSYADMQSLLQRVNSSTVSAGQQDSVQVQELARNIEIGKQLAELAGRIEITSRPGAKPAGNSLLRSYNDFILGSQQNLDQTVQVNAERLQTPQLVNALSQAPSVNQVLADGLKQQAAEFNVENNKDNKAFKQNVLPNDQAFYNVPNATSGAPDPKIIEKTSPEALRVIEQVLDALKKQDLTPPKEIKELSLQLQPAELGRVNISLKLENGLLNLVINTSEQSTGLLLQNSIQDLKNSLAQIGVNCGSFEMNYQPDSQPETETQFAEQYTKNGISSKDYDSDLIETEIFPQTGLNSYTGYAGSGYRINIRA